MRLLAQEADDTAQTNLTNNVETLRNLAHCQIAPHILGRMSLF